MLASHEVTNYRTAETGLVADHLTNAPSFREVQQRVMTLIRDKIIVGHNLWQFLSASDATFQGFEVADHRRDLACA